MLVRWTRKRVARLWPLCSVLCCLTLTLCLFFTLLSTSFQLPSHSLSPLFSFQYPLLPTFFHLLPQASAPHISILPVPLFVLPFLPPNCYLFLSSNPFNQLITFLHFLFSWIFLRTRGGFFPPSLLPCLKCACQRCSSATVFPELSRSLSP